MADSEWARRELKEIEKKMNGPGYTEIDLGIFVPEEDAFDYALERVSRNEDLKKMFVDWFYSGNWVFEDGK